MKKRRIIVAILIVSLIAICFFIFHKSNEPTYAGKPISYWLEKRLDLRWTYAEGRGVGIGLQDDSIPSDWIQAGEAIDAIGAEAIPYVFDIVRKEHTPFQERYREVWPRLPKFLQNRLPYPIFTDLNGLPQLVDAVLSSSGEAAIPFLIEALNDPNTHVREEAINQFGNLDRAGYDISDTIPKVVELFYDESIDVRSLAVLSLGWYGPKSRPAVPELIKVLDNWEIEIDSEGLSTAAIRDAAAYALGEIGDSSPEVLSALRALAENQNQHEDNYGLNPGAMITATEALWKLTGEAEYTVQRLIEIWPQTGDYEKRSVLHLISEIGQPASDAAPILTELLSNSDLLDDTFWGDTILQEATNALQKIDPDYF